jgi:hypothetical protein
LSRLVTEPELEAELVELALVATASQLDTMTAGCARVRGLNDPDREQQNHDERGLSVVLDDDGRGTVTMRGPVDLVAEFMVAIGAAVDTEPGNDGEGIGCRRFDAALAIARTYIEPVDDRAPTTIVVRAEGSATGDPDDAVRVTVQRMPISRAAYERLRCDAAIAVERFLDDGSIERTRTTDAIPRRVRRAVRNRDLGCCRWPGCDARASVHLHHIVWRSRSGPNTIENLVSLCHYHHRSIHHRGWSVVGDANGALQFVDGRGRIADEHTGRRAPILQGALARAQTASGFTPDPSTIATALGDRLQRDWAIGVLCDREEALQRRN